MPHKICWFDSFLENYSAFQKYLQNKNNIIFVILLKYNTRVHTQNTEHQKNKMEFKNIYVNIMIAAGIASLLQVSNILTKSVIFFICGISKGATRIYILSFTQKYLKKMKDAITTFVVFKNYARYITLTNDFGLKNQS